MSTPITTRAKLFISLTLIVIGAVANAEWKLDLSRRQIETAKQDLREPASTDQPIMVDQPKPGFFESLFESGATAGEIVVLNTEKGFVPSTIRVKKGLAYQIYVVNVNEKEKNVSFVLYGSHVSMPRLVNVDCLTAA